MSEQDVEQITKKMKSIGLSVPTEVYDEIVKLAGSGSIGGWCRRAIEEQLKPKPVDMRTLPDTIPNTETVHVMEGKWEVVGPNAPKPLKYQFGVKVPERPGKGGLG